VDLGVLPVIDQAILFGPTHSLVGVVTDPPPPDCGRRLPGFLFLNAGLVHRVGPNRLYVMAARRLAASGFHGLRFDFSGIGDSPARADHLPFQKSAEAEVRIGMDWLSKARRVDRFVLTGLCSGATFALQAACDDPRVVGVILINFQGPVTEGARSFVAQRAAMRYSWGVSLFSARSWGKVLTARADYRGILRSAAAKIGDMFGSPGPRTPEAAADLERVQALLARRVRVLAIYSEGDPGWDYLGRQLGDLMGRDGGPSRPSVVKIPLADHTFTAPECQRHVLRVIDEWASRLLPTGKEEGMPQDLEKAAVAASDLSGV
jgi:pimeloyl-ACP methyl ester carboxylesterase